MKVKTNKSFGSISSSRYPQISSPYVCKDMVNDNLIHELEVLSQKDIIDLVTKQQRGTPMKKK